MAGNDLIKKYTDIATKIGKLGVFFTSMVVLIYAILRFGFTFIYSETEGFPNTFCIFMSVFFAFILVAFFTRAKKVNNG